jgi:N-acetylneuraminic acid mutarotase
MTMHIMSATTVIRRRMTLGSLLLASLLASCGGGGGNSGSAPPVTTPPSDLQYPAAPTFVVDTAIAALTSTVVGQVTNYGVNPGLPAGLTLNTTSGVISGTPASVAARTSYTVEATNAGGSTTATVSIVVMAAAPAAPSDLNYPTPPAFVVSTAIAPVKPTVVGEVTSYSVSPALPAGLSLSTTTGVISGTPTTVAAKASYTVKAANAEGGTTATVSIVVMTAAPAYTAKSGVAQKGPLIQGSTVTAQELDANLSPTGQQFSYQILTNLGTFSPTSTFTSPYIGLNATGYYFDEVANAVSTGPGTLNAYSDLAVDSVLNVNLLTTLEYQRIQNLVTQSNITFAAARTQAETEVLAALNIPAGSYGTFDSFDLSGSTDGDHILAAISALFVYGNSAGPLSQLIANFQSDIGKNGVVTNPTTAAALVTAAEGISPTTVAANLTKFYAAEGLTFTAADVTQWIAQSGDGVIGKFAFSVPDATPSTVFTFPSYVVSQFAGALVSVTVGQLSVNGMAASGTVSLKAGDVVTISPSVGNFPNGVLNCYLVTGKTNLARVSFITGLVSIAVTPETPNVALGLTQQFTATGTFSDTSTANLTSSVIWTSSTPAIAAVGAGSGIANALATGSTVITATSGSVLGSTTLTVTPAVVESIVITPNPVTTGVGINQQLIATGTYSDGTVQAVTTAANWTSKTQSVATIGPTTGLATGVSNGSATISATIGSVTATAPLSVITDGWVATASMTAVRSSQTATMLPNGKVLVTGGVDNTGYPIASAEIYDPVAGTWTPTGSMTVPRQSHTATLLPNGTVLVAGGIGGTAASGVSIQTSAEIYDPVAGTWTATGSMTSPRDYYTATLLPNGTVLAAGGDNANGQQASAEIYDPVAGLWTATGSMTNARDYYTATLLPNGTVLVAGGFGGNYTPGMTSAEIYNPSAGTWTVTGSMTTAREFHTASLLPNGTVLVAGGFNFIGGTETVFASAEIYDPSAGTWTVTGSMTTERYGLIATPLPNGTVLVAGGDGNQTGNLASAEIYDPVAATWAATGSMIAARVNYTATLLRNGTVLAAGGAGASAEIFYP